MMNARPGVLTGRCGTVVDHSIVVHSEVVDVMEKNSRAQTIGGCFGFDKNQPAKLKQYIYLYETCTQLLCQQAKIVWWKIKMSAANVCEVCVRWPLALALRCAMHSHRSGMECQREWWKTSH